MLVLGVEASSQILRQEIFLLELSDMLSFLESEKMNIRRDPSGRYVVSLGNDKTCLSSRIMFFKLGKGEIAFHMKGDGVFGRDFNLTLGGAGKCFTLALPWFSISFPESVLEELITYLESSNSEMREGSLCPSTFSGVRSKRNLMFCPEILFPAENQTQVDYHFGTGIMANGNLAVCGSSIVGGDITACESISLQDVVLNKGRVIAMSGSVKAMNCTLPTIIAADEINLTNVKFRSIYPLAFSPLVVSQHSSVTAKKCQFVAVEALNHMRLIECSAVNLTLAINGESGFLYLHGSRISSNITAKPANPIPDIPKAVRLYIQGGTIEGNILFEGCTGQVIRI